MPRALAVALVAVFAWVTPADASFINHLSREINVKVVYYASPAAAEAPTANLVYIHGKTDPDAKSKLVKLETQDEHMLFFDFLPPNLGEIRGYKTRFHLYTAPPSAAYTASRALILKGADGIVFIADAAPKSAKVNRAALAELRKHSKDQGYDFDKMPVVFQLHGTGKKGSLTVEQLKAQLAIGDRPVYAADATTGHGVFTTLKSVAYLVLVGLKAESPDAAQTPEVKATARQRWDETPAPAKARPAKPATKRSTR